MACSSPECSLTFLTSQATTTARKNGTAITAEFVEADGLHEPTLEKDPEEPLAEQVRAYPSSCHRIDKDDQRPQ